VIDAQLLKSKLKNGQLSVSILNTIPTKYKIPLFSTTKCAPFRRWVVRIVKVGECY